MLKLPFIVLLALVLGLSKVSLLPLLPWPLLVLNPVLLAVILLIFVFDFNLALVMSLSGGLVLEFFSSAPFGLLVAALVLTAVGVNILALTIFTNRSWPAFTTIGLLGTLIYRVIFLISYLLVSLKIKTLPLISFKDYLTLTFIELLLNSLLLSLAYFIIYKSTKKFDERFIPS